MSNAAECDLSHLKFVFLSLFWIVENGGDGYFYTAMVASGG